jgi:hypothetical protein
MYSSLPSMKTLLLTVLWREGNIKFGKYTCNPFEMVLLEDMEILKIYT